MERHGDEIRVTSEEASASNKVHSAPKVLGISLLLVIAFLSVIWIYGAMTGDQHRPDSAVSNDQAKSEAVR